MPSKSLSTLIYQFRSRHPSRPILLLGAGASYRAGVPMAGESVKQIARASFAVHKRGMDWRHSTVLPSDWMPYLREQDWFIDDPSRFAENFPFAVKHFLTPKELRRELFADLIEPPNGINSGYRDLAAIIQRGLCWTVLTTNFDSLIVDALTELSPHVHNVTEINRTADDLVRFNVTNRRQIVYLHGSVAYYRDKNLLEETQRLDERLVRKLRPLLESSPIVVVGYRGAEPSITNHLLGEGIEDSGGYPHGIFWCVIPNETIHPNVSQLREKLGDNFSLVEIEGFDELMREVNRELKQEVVYGTADLPTVGDDTHPTSLPFERQVAEEVTLSELDHDLMLATLVDYCNHVRLPTVSKQNYLDFLRDLGLLVPNNGSLVPTNACFLLFGKDIRERFPYACIALTIQEKKRLVFEGNLLVQYKGLVGQLSATDINPILRIKGELSAEERAAYPPRALTELSVNMIVHRDYEAHEYSYVDFEPGRHLRFSNPGGLPTTVLDRVHVDSNGVFQPVRSATELRNEFLADIFYGLGSMDKAGSGLVDVQDIMLDHGGSVQYAISNHNTQVLATLLQPIQESPAQRVARKRSPVDLYITNLLPFKVIPQTLYFLPLREAQLSGAPLFTPSDSTYEFPIFVKFEDHLVSFADLSKYDLFAEHIEQGKTIRSAPVGDFIGDKDRRRVFVWLVSKHWEFFLRRWQYQGLFLEHKAKRAYFVLQTGERNRITYDSRARKGVKRDVVKPRERARSLEHENEGITYAVVEHGGQWALQIKPFYMFTRADGRTPIPTYLMSSRSTRRIKFDRNKNVDDDLSFWARYLSGGHETLNIGGVGVDDLIIEFEFCSVEVPVQPQEGGSDESSN